MHYYIYTSKKEYKPIKLASSLVEPIDGVSLTNDPVHVDQTHELEPTYLEPKPSLISLPLVSNLARV